MDFHTTWCALLLIATSSGSIALNCGDPGVPADGRLEPTPPPTGDAWTPGAEVAYRCRHRHQKLRGPAARRCQPDGRWNATRPWCDTNVAHSSHGLVWTGYWVDETRVVNDGDVETCFLFDQFNTANQHFHFQTYAFHQARVVVLHIEPRTFQEGRHLQVQVGQVHCRRSSPYDHRTLTFECHPETDGVLQPNQIEPFLEFHVRNSSQMFQLCEVEIYANPVALQCGTPEVPAHGKVIIDLGEKRQTAHYFCDDGYGLSGDVQRECSGRRWNGQQPVCISTSSVAIARLRLPTEDDAGVAEGTPPTAAAAAATGVAVDSDAEKPALIGLMAASVAAAVCAAAAALYYVVPRCSKTGRRRSDL